MPIRLVNDEDGQLTWGKPGCWHDKIVRLVYRKSFAEELTKIRQRYGG